MYTNEEILETQGNENLKKIKIWKSKVLNSIAKGIRKNRFLLATLSAFLIFSIVNAMMICTFFKILQKV